MGEADRKKQTLGVLQILCTCGWWATSIWEYFEIQEMSNKGIYQCGINFHLKLLYHQNTCTSKIRHSIRSLQFYDFLVFHVIQRG